jgi:CubicO group peptidase (beta-lactamase class C family)
VASVTKSVTSTLVGIAIGRHELAGVEQPVLPLFGRAASDPRKARVSVHSLLTMTSGLDCRFLPGEITLSQMRRSPDWAAFVLDLPMVYEPGAHFEYCSGGMHLLSALVSRAAHASTLAFARRELFGPLGIDTVLWPADPQGIQDGWGDLHLLPADMAKLGYLWLHDGRWEGRQVVPTEYLRAATQVQSHPGFSKGQEYGYGIWVYPLRTPPEFEGLGRGGQRITVVPGASLMIIYTGGGFEPGELGPFITRAVKGTQPLPADPAGDARLAEALQAAARPPLSRPPGDLPARAGAISGRTYALEDNPMGLDSLTLAFPGGAEALLSFVSHDRREGPRPVGLDGVPRLSPDGRFGLPVAVSGAWRDDSSFVIEYDEVANINRYTLTLGFSGDRLDAEVTEHTGLMHARFGGRARATGASASR